MNTKKRLKTAVFSGICFLSAAVALAVFFFNANSSKNIVTDTLISWGTGWHSYESRYAGSEFILSAENLSTISIRYKLKSKADQGIEILIDGIRKNSSLTNIQNDVLLTNIVNPKQRHTIVFRHYCSYLYDPCDLSVTQITINRSGKLLPVTIHKPILTVFGDSISTIYGSENYTRIVSDALQTQLHNASVMGSTVSRIAKFDSASDRYVSDVKPVKSKYILIFLGTNDAGNHVPIPIFQNAYSSIISEIIQWDAYTKLFLIGILPRKDIDPNILSGYDNVIKQTAQKYNIPFVDTSDWIQYGDLSDDIHPSIQSQKIIADKLLQFINAADN